jgi:TRAP-type uncharacterized transport system substrate-binding protein
LHLCLDQAVATRRRVFKISMKQNVVKNTFMPFHPGAARYYREIGIKIPDALVPMN